MTRRTLVCSEFSPQELRHQSRGTDDRRAGMRMQAIANSMDGMDRVEAARLADMSDQALIDAIKRYNAEGLAGLKDRPRPGRPRKMTAEQREEFREIVVKGPDVEAENLSAFTRDDLAAIVKKKWNVSYDVTSIGRTMRELKLSRQKTRPSHPKKNEEAGAAFKKGSGKTATDCRYTSD
jgi:transposase